MAANDIGTEMAQIRAASDAAHPSSADGNGENCSSLPGHVGSEAGEIQRGEVSAPPSCPAVDCRETDGVAGSIGRPADPSVAQRKTARPSPGAGSAFMVQVRLRLSDKFGGMLLRLRPSVRRHALMLALDRQVDDAFSLRELLSAAGELRRVGTLLNQALSSAKVGDLEPLVKEALALVDPLRRNERSAISTECRPKVTATSSVSPSVQVRLWLPRNFSDALMKLSGDSRGTMLMVALHSRIGTAFLLPELLPAVRELRCMGVLLNQALSRGELGHLESDVKEVLKLIDLFIPKTVERDKS